VPRDLWRREASSGALGRKLWVAPSNDRAPCDNPHSVIVPQRPVEGDR
jgi:hypothetical protein